MAFSFFYEAFDAFTQLKDARATAALKYMILMRILAGKVEFQKKGIIFRNRKCRLFSAVTWWWITGAKKSQC